MDQMVDQIKFFLKNTDPSTIQTVGAYLVGQAAIDKVVPLLKTQRYYYYPMNRQANMEIAAAVKNQTALLPRLGRYLFMLEYANNHVYNRVVELLEAKGLSLEQIFTESGLGDVYLLRHIFGTGYQVHPRAGEILTHMLRHNRKPLEEFVYAKDLPARVRPMACLSALDRGSIRHQKFDLLSSVFSKKNDWEDQLETDLLTCFKATVKRWGTQSERRFVDALGRYAPHLLPLYNSASSNMLIQKTPNSRYDEFSANLFYALLLSDFKIKSANRMACAACEANSHQFIHSLTTALYQSQNRPLSIGYSFRPYTQSRQETQKEIEGQLCTLTQWFERMEIPAAYLCAWAAGRKMYDAAHWTAPFDTLYARDSAALEKAMAVASPRERVSLRWHLHKQGEPLDETACMRDCAALLEERAADCNQENVRRVVRWLREGGEELETLPALSSLYGPNSHSVHFVPPNFDETLAVCALLSPMTQRFLRYLSKYRDGVHLEVACSFLRDFHGMSTAQLADYLDAHADPQGVIAALAPRLGGDCGSHAITKGMRPLFDELVRRHPDMAVAAMEEKDLSADTRLCLLDAIYEQAPGHDPDHLIRCLGDKSKKVRQHAVSFLLPKRELSEKVRPLLAAKKKELREAAEQLISAYDGAGAAAAEGNGDITDLASYCNRNLPKSTAPTLRWFFPQGVPDVRWLETGEPADPVVVTYYLHQILSSKAIECTPMAQKIRTALHPDDMNECARMAFHQWISENAPAKNKGGLLLLGLHAKDPDVLLLQRQIDEWACHSRGAIASEAVRAMALGGSDLALMTVDSIGRKFKNKQVRRSAQEAFAAAAQLLGTTPEALGDRIIPTLGFDGRGEKVIDYGSRQFTAILSPQLTIALQDGDGKTVKALPKPGARDDLEKAEAARAEFTALKKSLKAVVSTQGARLELALATGRCWDKAAWQKLFVENPIMHVFAGGLVWGLYRAGALSETFRYMEDGSFTTVEEEDLDLTATGDAVIGEAAIGEAVIGLAHPLDMGAELTGQWREQLSDYEVTQPLLQLDRPCYALEPGEADARAIDRFGGKKLPGITLLGKLQKAGWYKGSVLDAGCFFTFYKEVDGMGAQLNFSGMYVSPQPDEIITLGRLGFYQQGKVRRGGYVYDDLHADRLTSPSKLPARLLSEFLHEVALAVSTSTESAPDWRENRNLVFPDPNKR